MICEYSTLAPAPIRITGHKHTAVPLIVSALALRSVHLSNVPDIADTRLLGAILREGGARVHAADGGLAIDTTEFSQPAIPERLSLPIHGAVYLLPTVLGRLGRVHLAACGGCQIGSADGAGARPMHHMISVLARFGGHCEATADGIRGHSDGLVGCDVDIMEYSDEADVLTGPLVSGATKTAILAALAATGPTTIRHPYPKPDVTELLALAAVHGYAVHRHRDEDAVTLEPPAAGASRTTEPSGFRLISDLSQVMTYVCVAVWFRIPLQITLADADKVKAGLGPELLLLEQMGVQCRFDADGLTVMPPSRLRSVDIEVTSIGIYSDHQPFFALMLLGGDRPATIRERVWKDRFDYVPQLCKLGARIDSHRDHVVIHPSTLRAEQPITLEATDLRSAVVLLLAGLTVRADVRVRGIEHLVRGYESFCDDLARLGARLRPA
jgi:UDP-N-acetylglucosamine 1-carboxyvinyltransferase